MLLLLFEFLLFLGWFGGIEIFSDSLLDLLHLVLVMHDLSDFRILEGTHIRPLNPRLKGRLLQTRVLDLRLRRKSLLIYGAHLRILDL